MTDILFPPRFSAGDLAPWFSLPIVGRDGSLFNLSRMGGAYSLVLLFGSSSHAASREALAMVDSCRALFDGGKAFFFGITFDPADQAPGRLIPAGGAVNFLFDAEARVSRQLGAAAVRDGGLVGQPCWLIVDPGLRIAARLPLSEGIQAIAAMARAVHGAPPIHTAPILVVPQVIEPELCARLIAHYEAIGGQPSGFMRQVDGKTVGVHDRNFKRRRDCLVEDEGLRRAIGDRIHRRIVPMIKRAFHYEATRIERYIVACYSAEDQGHFAAHRDNTTTGTAHRRFAVTINLNGDFTGGDLRFPEFGPQTYHAPAGGAVVFSCTLLHEATPVTAGLRYATLPFLYDDHAAAIREENRGAIVGIQQTELAPAAA